MTLIEITAQNAGTEPETESSQSISARLTVSCGNKSKDVNFIHSTSEDEDELITWFIEKFAAQEPFDALKAAASRRTLLRYGTDLAECLCVAEVCEEIALSHIVLDIHETGGSNSKISTVHWELLENLELWPSPKPKSVCVARIPSKEHVHRPPEETTEIPFQPHKVVNIIVVSSRPGGAGDIPHRVVSWRIADIIRKLPDDERERVKLHLVRPATIDALELLLAELDKPEHLNIVHFDVHGEFNLDSQDVCLAFIQYSGGSLQPRLAPVDEVGHMLQKHGIRHAVLNACNSAYEFGHRPSFAKQLISYGLDNVVAMSFEASSSSVEAFMSTFYSMLLRGKSSFLEATFAGRQTLASRPMRSTRYGVEVEVNDFIVPVYYSSKGHSSTTKVAYTPQEHIDCNTPESTFDMHRLVGRESDIFLVETYLLLRTNIALVHGSPGIGKSSFLRHLCLWWEETGLVKDSIFYDMFTNEADQVVPLNTANICASIHLALLGDLDVDDEKLIITKVVQHLRVNNYALVFDNFEQAYLESPRDRQRFIVDFLSKLVGGKTLVIIGSRGAERMGALKSFTHHLAGLDRVSSTALASDLVAVYSKGLPDLNSDTVSYFERIITLAAGNPLAIQLLMRDFGAKFPVSAKGYYFSIMTGNGMLIKPEWLEGESENGARAMLELLALEDEYLLPTGLFWEYLPRAALAVYILMWTTEQEYRASGQYDAREMNLRIASGQFPEPLLDSVKVLEDHLSPYLDYLVQNRFLQKTNHPGNAEGPELNYMSMSPLVTIAFRSKLRGQALDSAKYALVYFQDYTTNKWPSEPHLWDDGEDTVISNVTLAFNNYLTAVSILLSRRLLGTAPTQSSSRLIQNLQWGIALDSSRAEVVVSLWDKALDRYWEKMEREGDDEDQQQYELELVKSSQPIISMVFNLTIDENGTNISCTNDPSIGLRQTKTVVRMVTQTEILKIVMMLLPHYVHDDLRYEDLLDRITWIRDHRVHPDRPPTEKQLYVSRLVDKLLEFSDSKETRGPDLHMTFPTGTITTETPQDVDDKRRLGFSGREVLRRALRLELKDLLKEYRFDEMRRKLESALDEEMNSGGNDPETRMMIHLNLSEVGLLSRDWVSAIQQLAFALSVRSGMARRPSLHSTIDFTVRMARNSLQANDTYKAFACIRSLLEISNRCFSEANIVCHVLDSVGDLLHETGHLEGCELSPTFLHARRMAFSRNDGSELENLEALAATEIGILDPVGGSLFRQTELSNMRSTTVTLIAALAAQLRSALAAFRLIDAEECQKKMIQLQEGLSSATKHDEIPEDILRYSTMVMRRAGSDLLQGKSIRKPGTQDIFSLASSATGEEILQYHTDFVDILLQVAGYKTTLLDEFLGIPKLQADAPELSSTPSASSEALGEIEECLRSGFMVKVSI
ncbi:uncharacterized protein FRV6_01024 [Fusarium oxysporum]|uniref:CHAT domain-containing protein n=1 Tax=Fusarium oxysporum TaxID=5507 RepID=A0A2H3SK01_FUSOX|nr:uncharacterized protein FRV6_01024 [Fusarium oxysporum]